MKIIKISKDLYVRDKYNVRRRVYVAGQRVTEKDLEYVLANNTVLNDDALPNEDVFGTEDVAIETKMLPADEPEEEAPAKKKKGKAKAKN